MPTADELVYIETEGSCAHCGFKGAHALTIHHLDQTPPKDERYDNKLVLCHNCHQSHHQGKGPTAADLEEIKKRLIIKTLTRPGLNALKIAARKTAVVAAPFLVLHLVEYGYLKHNKDLSSYSDEEFGGSDITIDAVYTITTAGRGLLSKWQLK
jgi:hypothetical protein